jgi:hypothetical protein
VDGARSVYHLPVKFVAGWLRESLVSIKGNAEHESEDVNETGKLSCLQSTSNQYWIRLFLLVNQGMDVSN